MFSEIKNKIRQYGLTRSMIRLLKLILRKLGFTYEQYLFCTLQLEKNKLVIKKKPSIDIEVKELSLDDFRNSKGIIFNEKKLNLIKDRFKKKTYVPLGCFYKSKLIYIAWISLKDFTMSYPCAEDIYALKDDEGLLLDIYCHPAYRRLGLASFMNTVSLRKMYEFEKRNAVVVLLKENIPARRSQAKVGFKCKKLVICVKIFEFSFSKIIEKRISLA